MHMPNLPSAQQRVRVWAHDRNCRDGQAVLVLMTCRAVSARLDEEMLSNIDQALCWGRPL